MQCTNSEVKIKMNNKTYANYLMHGRTKGSRNGISTTKGYTAVGQKAKGKFINGRYIYDMPASSANTDTLTKVSNPYGDYESKKRAQEKTDDFMRKQEWKEFDAQANAPSVQALSGADAIREQYRLMNEAKQKKAAKSGTFWGKVIAKNPGVNITRPRNEAPYGGVQKYTNVKYYLGKHQKATDAKAQNTINTLSKVPGATVEPKKPAGKQTNTGAAQQAALERWKKQNQDAIAAKKKAQAAKQPTNIGASQSADLARWSQQNRNNIAAKKKAAASKPSPVNWQNEANKRASEKEMTNKWERGEIRDGRYESGPNTYNEPISDKIRKKNIAANKGKANDWQNQAAKAASAAQAAKSAAKKSENSGAQNDWQQQAALERAKDQLRKDIAAKKKAAASASNKPRARQKTESSGGIGVQTNKNRPRARQKTVSSGGTGVRVNKKKK